jgi:hypothetical protein
MSQTAKVRLALLILIATVCCAPLSKVEAASVKGTITHRISGCDYFIVQIRSSFSILEWYGGHDPDKDDVLFGEMSTYGMKTIRDQTADESIKVWVEDYGLTKEDALEKLVEKCE